MQHDAIYTIGSSGIRLATPYLYAALGEMLGQLSGVLNLGVDGIMLMSAFFAWFTLYSTGSIALALLSAIACGLVMGLIMAFISVTMQADQGISGIGMYLFGLGMSEVLFHVLVGGNVYPVDGLLPVAIPFLTDIPVIGPICFNQNFLVYGAFLLVPVFWFVINRTTLGLKLRAAGQNPAAADSLGVRVVRIRYMAVTVGGGLSGLAGASLSIALLNLFQTNLTNGMGFIAVALVYFGRWRPGGVLLGALLFSMVNAFQLWAQVAGINVPPDFMLMLPYVITLVVLASMARCRVFSPAALNVPFERNS